MTKFCTIITQDFVPYAKSLYKSLFDYDNTIQFFVLVVDETFHSIQSDIIFLSLNEISETELVDRVKIKYKNNLNALRWSLKSVLMIHLLKAFKSDQVFFLDPDLYFFSDYKFLYDELGESSFLLSPHWKRLNPDVHDDSFKSLFSHGIYNAGFLGATSKGLETLYWWAEMCYYACEDNSDRGLFVDQKYLDLFPLRNPDSRILAHKGCNVAVWNRFECSRSFTENGGILINECFPVVFVHFTYLPYLIQHDSHLVELLKIYDQKLLDNGLPYSLIQKAIAYNTKQKLKSLNYFQRLVRKIVGKEFFSKYFFNSKKV